MKKLLFTAIASVLLLLPFFVVAQFGFDKVDYLKVDSIIYYQNPLVLKYDTIQEKNTMPVWFPAYCAEKNPFFFRDYIKEAPKYFHSMIKGIDNELKRKLDIFDKYTLKEIQPIPYEYVFAELWLTAKETNQKVILVISNNISDNIPDMDYNKLDTTLLGKRQPYFESNPDAYHEIYSGFTNTCCYIYEDSLWKLASQMYVIKELINKHGDIYYGGIKSFKQFIERADRYTRGRIVNGHRIFETVKNTPNGPVVVSNQAWYLKYWWALVIGLVIIALLALLIRRKSKK